jgi:hypothetical protein
LLLRVRWFQGCRALCMLAADEVLGFGWRGIGFVGDSQEKDR